MANEIEFSFLEPSDLMKKTTYDPNTDNVVDVAKDIEGFDTATDDTFYGKVGGVTGFFSVPAGAQSVNDLTDVDTSGITSGQVLQYNGSNFVPATITGGGAESISDLTDVDTTDVAVNNVLKYNGSGWVDGSVAYSEVTGTPTLSTVATSGLYTDLTGTPTLSTVATSGSYNDLSDKPTIPVSVNDLNDVNTDGITSGQVLQYDGNGFVAATVSSGATSIVDLTDVNLTGISTGQILNWDGSQFVPVNMPDGGGGTTPTLLGELTNVDTTGQATNDVLKFNGTNWAPDTVSYNELADQPTLFSGSYNDLVGTPTLSTVATSGSYNDLSDQPSIPNSVDDLDGVNISGITSGQVLQYDGSNFVPATITGGGAESIDDLTDVNTTDAVINNVLKYDGSGWVDGSVAYSEVTGTPTLSTVATSGSYNDLSDKPTIPSSVNDLTDVDTSGITTGQVLQYDGNGFVAATITGGGGAGSLDDLTDVDTTTSVPTSGDTLVYNGTEWVPQAPVAGGSGAKIERLRLNYVSNGDVDGTVGTGEAFSDVTSGIINPIVVRNNSNADVIIEFETIYNFPPASFLFYGYDATQAVYLIRPLLQQPTQFVYNNGTGSNPDTFGNLQKIRLSMTEADTGSSSFFQPSPPVNINGHAYLMMVFYD